jgi:hypothetical protein
MSEPADWAFAYARQAGADFRAWELYEQHPEALAAECHKLLFLQIACEKLCKAHLIRTGAQPEDLQASHGYIAKPLPVVIKQAIIDSGQNPGKMQGVLTLVRHLAREIEILNPAVQRDGLRPDNCEYPWEAGDQVISPLDWTFHPSHLVTVRGGPTFIKLLKGAIDRIINELEA